MPGYFRFLTLMAFHVFLDKKVDATILEVGIGGTYDSTNIVPNPIVTGITALGIDHVEILGNTIQDIARQKSGIFKVHYCASFIMFSEPSSRKMFLPSLLPSQREQCQYLKPEQWS
jgi:folylpolyglutamate synthase/dihydropteroate synthase